MNKQVIETVFQYAGLAGFLVLIYVFIIKRMLKNLQPPKKHQPSEKEMMKRIQTQQLIVVLASTLVLLGIVGYYMKSENNQAANRSETIIKDSPGSTIYNNNGTQTIIQPK